MKELKPLKKQYLFTPGPTPIPPEAALAMAMPIDYHRSSDAKALITDVVQKLKHVFQTAHDVMFLTSSGTGAGRVCAPTTGSKMAEARHRKKPGLIRTSLALGHQR